MRRRSLSVAAAVCLTLLAAAMMAIPASAVQVRETVQVDHMYNSWGATRFYDGLAGVTDRGAGSANTALWIRPGLRSFPVSTLSCSAFPKVWRRHIPR